MIEGKHGNLNEENGKYHGNGKAKSWWNLEGFNQILIIYAVRIAKLALMIGG